MDIRSLTPGQSPGQAPGQPRVMRLLSDSKRVVLEFVKYYNTIGFHSGMRQGHGIGGKNRTAAERISIKPNRKSHFKQGPHTQAV